MIAYYFKSASRSTRNLKLLVRASLTGNVFIPWYGNPLSLIGMMTSKMKVSQVDRANFSFGSHNS